MRSLKELAADIRAGERDFTEEEFEEFAYALERCPPWTPHQWARVRDSVAAQQVIIMQVVGGWKKKEAAIEHVASEHRMQRSQVWKALKNNSAACAELERELKASCAKIGLARHMADLAASSE